MAFPPLIPLTKFMRDQTQYAPEATTLHYTNDGKVMVPPQLFGPKFNLSKLVDVNVDGTKKLTAIGHEWTTKFWHLYPFVRSKRDDHSRPMPCEMSDAGRLDFANIMITYFGGSSTSQFGAWIKRDAIKEILRRCKKDGMKCSDGSDPTSIDDVYEIIKSLKGQQDHVVFNYIYNWVSSLTMESSNEWVQQSIKDYFKNNSLPLDLPPEGSFPTNVQRHFLVKLADKQGVQNIKEVVKQIQKKTFMKCLKLDAKVHRNAAPGRPGYNEYQQQMNDPRISIVEFTDVTYVPKTRLAAPLYVLESPSPTTSIGAASLHLTNAINSWPEGSLSELIEMLTANYNAQNAVQSNGSNANDDASNVNAATNVNAASNANAATNVNAASNANAATNINAASNANAASNPMDDASNPMDDAASNADDDASNPMDDAASNADDDASNANANNDASKANASDDDTTVNESEQNTSTSQKSNINVTDYLNGIPTIPPVTNVTTIALNALPSLPPTVSDEIVDDPASNMNHSTSMKEYVEQQIYYTCYDPNCKYVACEPCYDIKSEEALNVRSGRARGRARTQKLAGNKRSLPSSSTQSPTCKYDCSNNPFCMVKQNDRDYFTHSQMAAHDRFQCYGCSKYFKETIGK